MSILTKLFDKKKVKSSNRRQKKDEQQSGTLCAQRKSRQSRSESLVPDHLPKNSKENFLQDDESSSSRFLPDNLISFPDSQNERDRVLSDFNRVPINDQESQISFATFDDYTNTVSPNITRYDNARKYISSGVSEKELDQNHHIGSFSSKDIYPQNIEFNLLNEPSSESERQKALEEIWPNQYKIDTKNPPSKYYKNLSHSLSADNATSFNTASEDNNKKILTSKNQRLNSNTKVLSDQILPYKDMKPLETNRITTDNASSHFGNKEQQKQHQLLENKKYMTYPGNRKLSDGQNLPIDVRCSPKFIKNEPLAPSSINQENLAPDPIDQDAPVRTSIVSPHSRKYASNKSKHMSVVFDKTSLDSFNNPNTISKRDKKYLDPNHLSASKRKHYSYSVFPQPSTYQHLNQSIPVYTNNPYGYPSPSQAQPALPQCTTPQPFFYLPVHNTFPHNEFYPFQSSQPPLTNVLYPQNHPYTTANPIYSNNSIPADDSIVGTNELPADHHRPATNFPLKVPSSSHTNASPEPLNSLNNTTFDYLTSQSPNLFPSNQVQLQPYPFFYLQLPHHTPTHPQPPAQPAAIFNPTTAPVIYPQFVYVAQPSSTPQNSNAGSQNANHNDQQQPLSYVFPIQQKPGTTTHLVASQIPPKPTSTNDNDFPTVNSANKTPKTSAASSTITNTSPIPPPPDPYQNNPNVDSQAYPLLTPVGKQQVQKTPGCVYQICYTNPQTPPQHPPLCVLNNYLS